MWRWLHRRLFILRGGRTFWYGHQEKSRDLGAECSPVAKNGGQVSNVERERNQIWPRWRGERRQL